MPYCYVCGKAILNDEDGYCSDECYDSDSECDDGFKYTEQRKSDTKVSKAKALRTPPTSEEVGIRAGDSL